MIAELIERPDGMVVGLASGGVRCELPAPVTRAAALALDGTIETTPDTWTADGLRVSGEIRFAVREVVAQPAGGTLEE